MAVKNSILPKQNAVADNKSYQTDTGLVTLNPTLIKRYLVNGDSSAVTEQEIMLFMALCKGQKLNPFMKEAYLIKYGSKSPATMVVSKDVPLKRAEQNPNYDGKKAGVIVENKETGDIVYREGEFYLKHRENLVGGWCEVYRKDKAQTERSEVLIDEYIGRKANGEINSNWQTRPATMIRKVAVAHALREAFTKDLQGMYVADEMGTTVDTTESEKFETQSLPQEIVNPTTSEENIIDVMVEENDDSTF